MKYYKKLIHIFILSFLFLFVISEIIYKTYNKKIIDNATQFRLNQIKNENFKDNYNYLLMGSSITNQLVGINLHPYKNINLVNLTTVAATSLAGNLFLLDELSKKTKFKNVYIGIPYYMLNLEITDPKIQRYVLSAFPDNIESSKLKFMEKRLLFYKKMYDYVLNKENKLFFNQSIVKKDLNLEKLQVDIPILAQDNKVIEKIIQKSLKIKNYKLSEFNKYFIKKISEYEEKTGSKITIFIEPIPLTQSKEIARLKEEFKSYLLNEQVSFFDVNDAFIFQDNMFRDDTHLKNEILYKYESLLFTYILKDNR